MKHPPSHRAIRFVAIFALTCVAFASPHSTVRAKPVASAVSEIGITVDDLDRSVAFFTGVLGFEKVAEEERSGASWERRTGVFGMRVRVATLRLGRETIELTDYLAPRGEPFPHDTRANDRWFQHIAIVVSDMDAAYAKLRAARVEHASTGPQTLPPSIPQAAGIRAFYFRDPDGHFLELIQFPPDKGAALWQATKGAPLFLGIDHTAIVVRDTARALPFYRDILGLEVAGGSENFGTEQEHLNNVEHAHLRITTLRAPDGPGIELLEYVQPRDGRDGGDRVRPNDLAFWQTRVVVAEFPDSVATHLASVSDSEAAAVIVRDEDGHALELVRSRPL